MSGGQVTPMMDEPPPLPPVAPLAANRRTKPRTLETQTQLEPPLPDQSSNRHRALWLLCVKVNTPVVHPPPPAYLRLEEVSSQVRSFMTTVEIQEKDMITSASGNQYLKPDYLSPMPTSLDAKKSPLALLAQTCSQIGADSPPKPVEKKKESREKASPASVSSSSPKASFKPYDLDDKRSKTPAKSPRESPPGKDKYPDALKSPYFYPRMCRDPYCTGCLSGHVLGKPCPSGCTQCGHMAAAYAHAQLAALAAQPYICSWITGDSYCGKRFTSSEELLTHLRSHTGDPILPHPLLARSYPTPPLSPLSTARFHPYSKTLLPPTLPPFPYAHPGLPPYFPPYSLYHPRLGASHP